MANIAKSVHAYCHPDFPDFYLFLDPVDFFERSVLFGVFTGDPKAESFEPIDDADITDPSDSLSTGVSRVCFVFAARRLDDLMEDAVESSELRSFLRVFILRGDLLSGDVSTFCFLVSFSSSSSLTVRCLFLGVVEISSSISFLPMEALVLRGSDFGIVGGAASAFFLPMEALVVRWVGFGCNGGNTSRSASKENTFSMDFCFLPPMEALVALVAGPDSRGTGILFCSSDFFSFIFFSAKRVCTDEAVESSECRSASGKVFLLELDLVILVEDAAEALESNDNLS